MDLRLTEFLPDAALFSPELAFVALREAQNTYPDHAFRFVGPLGLLPNRGYRLHAFRLTDGGFDGYVREVA